MSLYSKLLFLIFLFPILFYAQTGSISGKVIDRLTGEAIIGVIARIELTSLNAITDTIGNFEIKDVPIGKYNLIFTNYFHQEDTLKSIEIKAGEVTLITKTSSQIKTTLSEINISSFKPSDTEIELIKQMKNSNQITSGISSEQINKGQDRDASEEIGRAHV